MKERRVRGEMTRKEKVEKTRKGTTFKEGEQERTDRDK